MADRQVAVKSIIAAMNAMSNIQQNKTKLLTTMLEGSQKFQDSFLLNMMKNRQEIDQKKELMPLELEQKKQEKALPNQPTKGYKDILFENITQKDESTWKPWEKNFVEQYTGGGDQAIVDNEGNILGYKPKRSVFQPKQNTSEDPFASLKQTETGTMKQSNKMPSFNSTKEADMAGLPSGSIVLVGGRRYQL